MAAVDGGARRGRIVTYAIARGRNAVARHERLREHLAALERGGGTGWSEDAQSVRAKQIRDALVERRFGPDDREIDLLAPREREKRIEIGRGDRHRVRNAGDAGVAGRGHDMIHVRLACELPRQRVLAAAVTDHEDLHRYACKLLTGNELRGWLQPGNRLRSLLT
jgi:hypothetical protein